MQKKNTSLQKWWDFQWQRVGLTVVKKVGLSTAKVLTENWQWERHEAQSRRLWAGGLELKNGSQMKTSSGKGWDYQGKGTRHEAQSRRLWAGGLELEMI